MRKLIVVLLVMSALAGAAQQNSTIFENSSFVVEPIKTINTVGSDISPFFIDDSLYFSGIRESYFNKDLREKKNKAFYDIYSAGLNSEGILTSGRSLVPGFGNEFHEGPASYCEKTGELFVTLSNVINPDTLKKMFSVENVRLRIAVMKMHDGKWKLTEEMPFNNDKYNFAHPAINYTGDTLIFTSNIDSVSFGKNDLFMSVKTDGKWSMPINLGNAVNTLGNEMFPTFIGKNILTFSSDARNGGYGSLDIWYTKFPRGEIKNAGNKINTHLDDFGLVIHKSGKTAYFASDRGGVGSDDIYRLDIKPIKYVFNGKVTDRYTSKPIESASVVLTNCDGENLNTVFSDGGGMFQLEVLAGSCPQVEAAKTAYKPDKKDISGLNFIELRLTPEKKHEILVMDVDTKKPVAGATMASSGKAPVAASALGMVVLNSPFRHGEKMVLSAPGYLDQSLNTDTTRFKGAVLRDTVFLFKKELNKTFVLDNIYYNYDKWDILPASKLELNRLVKIMNDNPQIKVELGSHTDARGSDSYNLQLSQKRSDSAVAYIISSGIPKSRIVAKGYGETKLVNHCKNGVQCADDLHRQNRRTEFKLIGL